jgi:hypothetical protein
MAPGGKTMALDIRLALTSTPAILGFEGEV